MHREFPSVFRLAIHLPDQQPVTFDPSRNRTDDGTNPLTRVLAQAQHTTLTRWFQFNKEKNDHILAMQTNPEALPHPCLSTLYHDFPKLATWESARKTWKQRRNNHSFPPICRIFFVTQNTGECYFL